MKTAFRKVLVATAGLTIAAGMASAQDISKFVISDAAAKRTLIKNEINAETARKIIDKCIDIATKANMPITIFILSPTGQIVASHRMDGQVPINIETALLKAQSVLVTRDSTHLRTALAEVRDGIRSAAEARFRQRIQRSDLPPPRYNVFLRAADGTDIGEADAWWADAGVSAEIDSQEYHFYRDGWLRTDAKHSRMLKYGILPHHFAPSRVDNDWAAIYDELKSSIHEGRQRPRLRIVAFEAFG